VVRKANEGWMSGFKQILGWYKKIHG
jgi:hypothetical protein